MLWQDEAAAAVCIRWGGWGRRRTLRRAIVFLASDAADWMTGVDPPG